jgi:hypothetical protein
VSSPRGDLGTYLAPHAPLQSDETARTAARTSVRIGHFIDEFSSIGIGAGVSAAQ